MKNNIKEKYENFQVMQRQIAELNKYLEELDQKLMEYMQTKQSLVDINECEAGTEILVPLAGGIFVRASLLDNESFIVNVGGDTVIEKNVEQVSGLIEKQIKEIKDSKVNISDAVVKLNEKLLKLATEIQKV